MKKKNIGICLVLIALMLSSSILIVQPIRAEETGYTDISAQEAHQMLKNNQNIVVVDVRNESEYDIGHLCNAILIPVFQLQQWLDSPLRNITSMQVKPNVNDTVIVYCLSGTRSAVACQMLAQNGFTHVYNLLGGVQSWMDMGYPLSTTFHKVVVDVINDDTSVDIEPLLKTYCGCGKAAGPMGCSSNPDTNITKTIQASIDNVTVINMHLENNGTTADYNITKTTLWSYNDNSDGINRTITFNEVNVTNETQSTQFYSLRDDVQAQNNYNLSMITVLIPLDSQTYNSSLTYISYIPAGSTKTESMELIGTNSTVSVSQLYRSLSKVADKLSKEYAQSQDVTLHKFEQRYADMANEAKLVSNLVEHNLAEYNKNILKSTAIIVDDFWYCLICDIVVNTLIDLGLEAGCQALAACTAGLAEGLCFIIANAGLGELGYVYVCEEWANCWGESPPSNWYANNYYYTYTVQQGYVQNPSYICGSSGDGSATLMFAGSYGDQAFLYLQPNGNDYVHGDVSILARSYTGIYSTIWLWVWDEGASTWHYVNSLTINPSGSYTWYDFGYTTLCFKYFLIGTYDWGSTTAAYLDAVHITP